MGIPAVSREALISEGCKDSAVDVALTVARGAVGSGRRDSRARSGVVEQRPGAGSRRRRSAANCGQSDAGTEAGVPGCVSVRC